MSSCNVLQLSAKARTYVYDRYIENPRSKGAFNNYVDKNRGEGVSRKSTVGHVKVVDSKYVKCPCLLTRGKKIKNG